MADVFLKLIYNLIENQRGKDKNVNIYKAKGYVEQKIPQLQKKNLNKVQADIVVIALGLTECWIERYCPISPIKAIQTSYQSIYSNKYDIWP